MDRIKQFFLNGELYTINQDLTILELVNYFNYKDTLLVLEYNTIVCSKKNWGSIILSNNDIIEIVTIVGGG